MSRNPPDPSRKRSSSLWGLAVLLVLVIGGLVWKFKVPPQPPTPASESPAVSIQNPAVVEYRATGPTPEAQRLTDQRKEELKVSGGLDLLVTRDESLKLGSDLVPMKEILGRIGMKKGDILETDLKGIPSATGATTGQGAGFYGIHVVQPGDNIWNIHFQFLKDYFQKRGIALSSNSDEPKTGGASSGVGRILKFSETMVYVYNVRERRLAEDLDLIHPLTKIVVFDIGQVFALLDQIDYAHVNRIRYDGETLWLPAKE